MALIIINMDVAINGFRLRLCLIIWFIMRKSIIKLTAPIRKMECRKPKLFLPMLLLQWDKNSLSELAPINKFLDYINRFTTALKVEQVSNVLLLQFL